MSPSPPASAGWKLAAPTSQLTQGLVASGFGALETGRALFLELGAKSAAWDGGGRWLTALAQVAPITNAVPPAKSERSSQQRAAAIAFTWTGLARMGLSETALASFARPFREGMLQEDRSRRLGDRRSGTWLETVIAGGPRWSANTPLREDAAGAETPGAYDVAEPDPREEQIETPVTVHAVLLLYAASEADANQWCVQVETALKPHDVHVAHRLPLVLDVEGQGISREHFGFADGLSQPVPYDDTAVTPPQRDPVQGVPLGEFLIGYTNGHHEKAPGPVVPDDPSGCPAQAGLPPHPQAEGFFDFGLNGSYMVVRELKQDVAAFWNSMDANAARIREQDPAHSGYVSSDWIAERVVGRNRDGHLLCPGGTLLPADGQNMPANDYLFHERDPFGVGCPVGSHVRRANPRDALAPNKNERQTLLNAANNHRILRRGRKYGPKIADLRRDDGADRGLLFVCLNTDIARQFEFVQHTWLLNSNFATLFEETDPLVGPEGRMTIREEPLRRTLHVDTFVQLVGGDYFFLPSMPALAYLAML